jgi:ATP-dependent DNA ligase
MNMFYEDIVENKGLEGLIFKDLLAPYVLGAESRSLRYWNKMKPDYATDGHSASDIDAVIIGAYYATGMGKAGTLNAFLIGCVDENNRDHFMTLCKVNGGSVNRETLQKMFKKTGFTKNDEGAVSYGNWFREAKHGKSLPDFISERSFQTGSETENGWICQAKKYPDLWIHPEDSVVVTLNCGEVTTRYVQENVICVLCSLVILTRFPTMK